MALRPSERGPFYLVVTSTAGATRRHSGPYSDRELPAKKAAALQAHARKFGLTYWVGVECKGGYRKP